MRATTFFRLRNSASQDTSRVTRWAPFGWWHDGFVRINQKDLEIAFFIVRRRNAICTNEARNSGDYTGYSIGF